LARQKHQGLFQRAVPRQGPPHLGVWAPENVEAPLHHNSEGRVATSCLVIKRHGPPVLLARHCLINSRR
jgi:hypothetical protein